MAAADVNRDDLCAACGSKIAADVAAVQRNHADLGGSIYCRECALAFASNPQYERLLRAIKAALSEDNASEFTVGSPMDRLIFALNGLNKGLITGPRGDAHSAGAVTEGFHHNLRAGVALLEYGDATLNTDPLTRSALR